MAGGWSARETRFSVIPAKAGTHARAGENLSELWRALLRKSGNRADGTVDPGRRRDDD
jgi:hypothetical protein